MSNFVIWHLLAICTVIAVSFLIGYSTAKQQEKESENYGSNTWTRTNPKKNCFRHRSKCLVSQAQHLEV